MKPGCHLCDQMATVLAAQTRFRLETQEVDVTKDPDLHHLEPSVPLLLLDGVPTFRFTVTPQALSRVLEERGCPRS